MNKLTQVYSDMRGTKLPEKSDEGNLLLGDKISYQIPVFKIGPGDHPILVITAGIHGDEPEGVLAVYRLLKGIKAKQLAGTMIAIPVANPPACMAESRLSPIDSKNLNRLFPGIPNNSPSDILADYLFRQVVLKADALVDLHSGGRDLHFLPTALYATKEGEDDSRRKDLAKSFGTKLVLARPFDEVSGTLFGEATRADILAIGVEAGGSGICTDRNITILLNGVYNVLTYLRMFESQIKMEVDQYVGHGLVEVAPISGLIVWKRNIGEFINRGEDLALIYETISGEAYPVRASASGIIAFIRTAYSVEKSERIAMIGTKRGE
jgi:predicted deacylase